MGLYSVAIQEPSRIKKIGKRLIMESTFLENYLSNYNPDIMKKLLYSNTDYWVVAREADTNKVVWRCFLRSYLWYRKRPTKIFLEGGRKYVIAYWLGGEVTIDASTGKVMGYRRVLQFPTYP